MADYQVDKFGGEYRVVEGQEMIALWLPMTLAQKEELMKKAAAEKTHVGLLVANFLHHWLKGEAPKELSLKDLEQVTGGLLSLYRYSSQPKVGAQYSTVMCPW